jgi:hypothetical protein
MKDFTPHQESLALKELGFDEPCLGYWSDWGTQEPFLLTCELGTEKQSCSIRRKNFLCSAPTYSQAFRFFREKYDLRIWIESNHRVLKFEYVIATTNPNFIDKQFNDLLSYRTHEEAELECLNKLIEIVESK